MFFLISVGIVCGCDFMSLRTDCMAYFSDSVLSSVSGFTLCTVNGFLLNNPLVASKWFWLMYEKSNKLPVCCIVHAGLKCRKRGGQYSSRESIL